MVYFQTTNPNLGKFRIVLHWQMLVYFMDIWSILRLLEYFCYSIGDLVYIFPVLVCFTKKIWQPCSEMVSQSCPGRRALVIT
jgi:hypothetical protein